MASRASLIVTPLRFRAVTSSPSGKCRSIFLTGGLVKNFLSASFSSSVAGDVFNFLQPNTVTFSNRRGRGRCMSYQLSFWVSLAISSSFPSFSAPSTRQQPLSNMADEEKARGNKRPSIKLTQIRDVVHPRRARARSSMTLLLLFGRRASKIRSDSVSLCGVCGIGRHGSGVQKDG